MQQWICSKLTCCCLVVEVIEFAICWCERLLCPTDLWICRNILEIESQKENNNQKHWTVKYVLPFQWLQVAPLCACQINRCYLFNFWRVFFLFFVPKGFNWEAASGPRPEALALVLPDSELPAFWKLPLDDIITSCWTQLTVGDTWAGSSYTLPCPLPHSNRPTFKSRPVSESRRGGRPAAHLTCPSTNLIYRPTFPLTDTRNSLAVHSQRSGKV